jgi:4-alpha-glucanotransferase
MMAEFGGIDWEKEESLVYNDRIQWKLIDGLLASRSKYAALMITDLYGMSDRFNKPGTVGGENWRFRLPFTLDHAYRDSALADRSVRLRQSSREMGRAKIAPAAAI